MKHLVPYESSSNIVISVMNYFVSNGVKMWTTFVVKMPKNNKELYRSKIGLFKNEVLFYSSLDTQEV